MATIKDYFKQAQLSQAAYAQNLLPNMAGGNDTNYVTALEQGGMSSVQAIAFAKTYTVIDQYTDPDSGFSGTLFRNTVTGEYTFALRGTQPSEFVDDIIFADFLGIVVEGWAQEQIAEMNAYFERLITPVSQGGLEKLSSTDTVTVAGHSLGGHLATAFTLAWPDHVDHAYTYNGAGTGDTDSGAGYVQLLEILGLASSTPEPNDKITNLYAEPGLELTAGVGVWWGDVVPVFIEDQGIIGGNLLIGNHSIAHLTDSLAVYNLFSQIEESLQFNAMTGLLETAAHKANHTLESAVTALGKLFVTGFTPRTSDEYDANRDNLYNDIESITGVLGDTSGFSIETLATTDTEGNITPLSPCDIETHARTAIAYRYALVNLNPFAVVGDDSLYTNFNQEGELDIFDPATGQGQLSDKYLTYRAEMLSFLIEKNINDGYNESTTFFEDKTTGETVFRPELSAPLERTVVFGSDQGEELEGTGPTLERPTQGDRDDFLFGMGGNDTLNGFGGDDYLEGGKGQDTLNGGEDNDTFYIQGTDTDYDIFNGGEGNEDKILGSSGDDTIRIHEFSPDHSIERIIGGGGEDIIAGTDMGDTIDLSDTELIGIDRIEGGANRDTITGSDGDDILYGGSRDMVEDNAVDYLNGGLGNDIYHVGNGDIISDSDQLGIIRHGSQQISGLSFSQRGKNSNLYEADNYLAEYDSSTRELQIFDRVNAYSFTIENFNSGDYGISLEENSSSFVSSDIQITGTEYRDEMSLLVTGSVPSSWELSFTSFPDPTQWSTPFFSQWLTAVTPRLDITGGSSGDFLFGFTGHDLIDGGAGNDLIFGQIDTWEGSPLYTSNSPEGDTLSGGLGRDYIVGGGGQDDIRGGADNDFIQGYDGKDNLFGDSGNDVLAGGADDAVLYGGDGDDALFGDGYFTGSGLLTLDNIDQLSVDYTYTQTGYAEGLTSHNFTINNDAPIAGNDVLSGGDGRDYLDGGKGDDTLLGGTGHDSLLGGDGDDFLDGGADNDCLVGDNVDLSGAGNDSLSGGDGIDHIYGAGGNDIIHGDAGDDSLFGGDGLDLLHGGTGNDVLKGEAGNDEYVLNIGDGVDYIEDAEGINTVYFTGVANVVDLTVKYARVQDSQAIADPDGRDLWIDYSESDAVIIKNGRDNNSLKYKFSDGSVFSHEQLLLEADVDEVFVGGEEDETLSGGNGDDMLTGNGGNDILFGGGGNDTLIGNDGDDALHGDDGDDILDGGAGDDYLSGGNGNDTYLWGVGSGQDVLDDKGFDDIDTVQIGDGVTPYDLIVASDDNGFYLGIKGRDDLLKIDNWLPSLGLLDVSGTMTIPEGLLQDQNRIDRFVFTDGTVWTPEDLEDISSKALSYNSGTIDDDRLIGDEGDNYIDGFSGDDDVYAREGNDYLIGREGNDALYGEQGNDRLFGGLGNDYLDGGEGDDILNGGTKDVSNYQWDSDYLTGGIGSDLYIFNKGFGASDRVYDTSELLESITDPSVLADNIDTIRFGEGITPDDFIITRSGRDVWLTIKNNNDSNYDDKLVLLGYESYNEFGKIERFEFSDGNIWTSSDLWAIVNATTEGDDVIHGYEIADELIGLSGDDEVLGHGGDDTLDGGSGNDYLAGGIGNDTLIGGDGDDIYIYSSGADTIDNSGGGIDRLEFTDGISSDRLSYIRNGDDLIIRIDNSDTSQVTVTGWFVSTGNQLSYIQPSGESGISAATINALFEDSSGGEGTGLFDSSVEGTESSEQLVGTSGSDLIQAYAGDDQLFGLSGDDRLEAGDGADYLDGGAGSDIQLGGTGNDQLGGDAGDDTLIGGTGDDTYVYRPGSGADTIDNSDGGTDWLIFTDDLTSDRLSYIQNGDDLIVRVDNAETSQVTVTGWFVSPDNQLSYIQPADQSGIAAATINALFETTQTSNDDNSSTGQDEPVVPAEGTFDSTVSGTDSAEQVVGTSGSNLLQGFAGDDQLFGLAGDDWLEAGDGADYLDGGDGADTQLGGAGNDQLGGDAGQDFLIGGEGDDIYVYRPGSGADTIDNSGGGTDWLIFTDDITEDRLTYHRAGDDLLVKIDGDSSTMVTVKHWFDGDDYKLSYIQPSGGYGISAASIESMLSTDPDSGFDALLVGTDVTDMLTGTSTDDQLCGYDGDDQLYGLSGTDELSGDDGDDNLWGGTGDDRYVFNLGDGNDVISDESGSDTIFFGDEVTTRSVAVFMNEDTLQIGYGTADIITLSNYSDSTTGNRIENITMSDGSTMTDADINQLIQDMSAYAVTEGISLNSLADVRQNEELMTMIAGSWQAA